MTKPIFIRNPFVLGITAKEAWTDRGVHLTFSWGAEGWYKAPRWPSSGLRGLLMAAYSLLLPMVAFVTSYGRVTPGVGTSSERGTWVKLPQIVRVLFEKQKYTNVLWSKEILGNNINDLTEDCFSDRATLRQFHYFSSKWRLNARLNIEL